MEKKTQKTSRIRPLQRSASLILTLPGVEKILMLVRTDRICLGGSLVFPGGTCEMADAMGATNNQFEEYGKVTAIRETLQEAGLLLLPSKYTVTSLEIFRSMYQNKQFKGLSQRIAEIWGGHLDELQPITRWVSNQEKDTNRFDTIFYLPSESVQRVNLVPESTLEQLQTNPEQCQDYLWISPLQALKLEKRGRITLHLVTKVILSCICKRGRITGPWGISLEPICGILNQRFQGIAAGDACFPYREYQQNEPQSESRPQVIATLRRRGAAVRSEDRRRTGSLVVGKDKEIVSMVIIMPEEEDTILKFIKICPKL